MAETIPPSKIINIFEATNASTGSVNIDISPSLGLDNVIAAHYIRLPSGQRHEFKVEGKKILMCYILSGNGQLTKGEHTADLSPSDCFSFPAVETENYFALVASKSELSALVISDLRSDQQIASAPPPDFPTIISAEKASKWRRDGINTVKGARLGLLTDMKNQGSPPWNLTLIRLPPGTQSSNAHAHSVEEEFALILEGKARYWHQGESPEKILVPGDAVGWKAGTGICHTLLNDAEDEAGAGQDLVFLVWGDDSEADKVHYATSHPPWWTSEIRWFDCLIHPKGSASGLPYHPRPADRPYPS